MSSIFVEIPSLTTELAALERLEKSCNHSSAFILIGPSSFLQVTSTTIKFLMASKFCQIRPPAVDLAALERHEKSLYRLIMGELL